MTSYWTADEAEPLWDEEPMAGAFTLADPDAALEEAVVTAVDRPWLFGYAPVRPGTRAMLVLAGGGYTQLMVGREGVVVARWLAGLGLHAFVLVHRFPTAQTGALAPVTDAERAMATIRARGFASVAVMGLSSGGHLAACLLSDAIEADNRPDVAVIGYAPISTNAAGRTVVADKPPLVPPEKQQLYDQRQPDALLAPVPPPCFIVYAANDEVVPVANAYRFADAVTTAGGQVELHVFVDAPHGFALDTPDRPVTLWPALCEAWLRQMAFLPPPEPRPPFSAAPAPRPTWAAGSPTATRPRRSRR